MTEEEQIEINDMLGWPDKSIAHIDYDSDDPHEELLLVVSQDGYLIVIGTGGEVDGEGPILHIRAHKGADPTLVPMLSVAIGDELIVTLDATPKA